jgi:hypothetical protein
LKRALDYSFLEEVDDFERAANWWKTDLIDISLISRTKHEFYLKNKDILQNIKERDELRRNGIREQIKKEEKYHLYRLNFKKIKSRQL